MTTKSVSPLPEGERVSGASMLQCPQVMVKPPKSHLQELGPWSSHPSFALKRLAACQIACLATAAILIAALVLTWIFSIDRSDFIDAILSFPTWFDAQSRKLVIVAAIVGFLLSALLTGTLQIRASFIRSLAEPRGGSPVQRWVVACILLACVASGVPFVVARCADWNYAILIDVLALAPLPILAAMIEWGVASQDSEKQSFPAARFGMTLGMIAFVVAPFALFQLFGGYLRADVSGWIASGASAIDINTYVKSGALIADAPAWLRGIAEGNFGTEAATQLRSAIAAIDSGNSGSQEFIASVASAIQAPIERICRVIAVLLVLPGIAMVVGHSVYIGMRAKKAAEKGTSTPKADAKPAADSLATRPGCFGRVFGAISRCWRWVMGSEPEKEGEEGDAKTAIPIPPWVDQFFETQQKGEINAVVAASLTPLNRDDAPGVSPLVEGSAFDWLFGGTRPSQDQQRALTIFRDRYEKFLAEQEQVGFGGDEHLHPDFFIESRPGAGASTTLMALALYAAAARGQRVLFLKSNREGSARVAERLRSMLTAVAMEELLRVGELNEAAVQRWSDPDKHAAGRNQLNDFPSIPDILVGTLSDWERICQSPALARDQMRAALLGIEVVLVDDFGRGRGEPVQSMHLPFSLDKHRLFLRSEFRLLQLVVACPRLDDGTREMLSKRLFGGNGSPCAHPLRPWKNANLIRVEVEAESGGLDEALISCVKFCISNGLKTLVYRQDAGDEWVNQLRESVGDSELLETASDPEALPFEVKSGFNVVLYRRTLGEDAAFAIAARAGDGTPVFMRIAEAAQSLTTAVDPIPVLASARSRALFFAHLRSVTAYLAPGAPVTRNDWVRFGLRERGNIHELACLTGERFKRKSRAPTLLLDPPDSKDGLADPQIVAWDRLGVWPSVTISHESTGLERDPIDLDVPIEDQSRAYLAADGASLLFGETDRMPDQRRVAVWLSPRSEEFAELDLAHADLIRVRRGDRWFRAVRAESALANRASRHQIRSDFYHDEPHEPLIPVLSISFDIEPHARVLGPEHLGLRTAEWYTFEAARKPLICTTAITRLADERGHESPLGASLEFELDVSISVLAVGMTFPDADQQNTVREHWVRSYFAGKWTTQGADTAAGRADAREIWTSLTAVFQIALRELMPDMLSFARVLVFHPPRGGCGAAVFFIEPLGTAGTAVEAMQSVLSRPSLRDRFVEALRRGVAAVRKQGQSLAYAPRYEGARCIGEGMDFEGIDAVIDWIEDAGTGKEATSWKPEGEVGIIESPGASDATPWVPAERESVAMGFAADGALAIASDADYEWNDGNCIAVRVWRGDNFEIGADEKPIRYGIQFGSYGDAAKRDSESFGYEPARLAELSASGADARAAYLTSVGFQENAGAVWASYEWMIKQSLETLRPLALRIIAQCETAGSRSQRAKLAAMLSFVVSMKYEIPTDLGDGKDRFEVHMPSETLDRRAGDCDSMSVLFLALIRAANLATGYVVVTHNHAMVALKVQVEPYDDFVNTAGGKYLMVECTEDQSGTRRLGRVSRDLIGTSVRVES